MTFRRRLTVSAAAAVAVAVVLASLASWIVVRSQLRGQVDDELRQRAALIHARVPLPQVVGGSVAVPPPLAGDRVFYMQVVTPRGAVIRFGDGPEFAARSAGPGAPELSDQDVDGTHFRVYSERVGGFTLTLAAPLTDVDGSLRQLALILLLVAGGGVALAIALGGGVTAAAVGPVRRLTEAAERVTETGDLTHRIEAPPTTDDEIGRLTMTFNGMLAALEASVGAQKQLVADASHELRTPITSIRTNIDVLASGAELEPDERARLLVDLTDQLEELTTTVNDLVELARDGAQPAVHGDVRLDRVVAGAIEAFGRHARDLHVVTDLDPCVVTGDASRIDRAVRNLLDNAAKWSPPDGVIEVSVRDGILTVRDHGPGFPQEDLPHVFDRFYRSTAARSKPGSGLGLAIVRQVVESHGGRVSATNADDGGAIVRVELLASGAELPPPP